MSLNVLAYNLKRVMKINGAHGFDEGAVGIKKAGFGPSLRL
ncbi:hypothetical protein [Pseudomonas sp. S2_F03]